MGLLDADGREISELRETKTRTIGFVYDAIRRINQEVGELLSDQFENLEGGGEVASVLNEKASKS